MELMHYYIVTYWPESTSWLWEKQASEVAALAKRDAMRISTEATVEAYMTQRDDLDGWQVKGWPTGRKL